MNETYIPLQYFYLLLLLHLVSSPFESNSDMSPTPAPFHPLLSNVNTGWGKASFFMKWFSKLVGKTYGWSDGLIAFRQNKVNKAYKFEKAEKEALRIMKEQQNQREGESLGKRELHEQLDLEEFAEFLETF